MTAPPQTVVVKIGGAQLEQDAPRAALCCAVAHAVDDGHRVVLVHGGGNQIRTWTERLGLPQRYDEGLRITDADTAEVVTAVLGGLVNKQLVAALGAAGVRACGLAGVDGGTLQAAPHRPGGRDLGFVGHVDVIDTALLTGLLDLGVVPVVATVAALAPPHEDDRSRLYNINADMAAAPLAQALGADALLFLSDVAGVLDRDGALVRDLDPAAFERLRAEGVLQGGMLPKVHAARSALVPGGPALVKIASADGDDAVRAALDARVGTRLWATARPGEETAHG